MAITIETITHNMQLQTSWANAFAAEAQARRELHAAQLKHKAAQAKLEALESLRGAHVALIMEPN